MRLWMRCRDERPEVKRRVRRTELGVETAIEEWKSRHGLNVGNVMKLSGDGELGGGVKELGNYTETYDDMLRICWTKQDCSSCLNEKWMDVEGGGGRIGCSWCPGSQTCIPNPYSPPLFAPVRNPDICPLWYERWELRTKPLGCYVSTTTFLSVIVAVILTLLVVGILIAIGFGIRSFAMWSREERNRGWWKVWRWRVELRDIGSKTGGRGGANGATLDERAPLLGSAA